MNDVANDKLYAVIDVNGDDAFKIICFFKLSPAIDTVKIINTQNSLFFSFFFFFFLVGSVLLVEDIFQME